MVSCHTNLHIKHTWECDFRAKSITVGEGKRVGPMGVVKGPYDGDEKVGGGGGLKRNSGVKPDFHEPASTTHSALVTGSWRREAKGSGAGKRLVRPLPCT